MMFGGPFSAQWRRGRNVNTLRQVCSLKNYNSVIVYSLAVLQSYMMFLIWNKMGEIQMSVLVRLAMQLHLTRTSNGDFEKMNVNKK